MTIDLKSLLQDIENLCLEWREFSRRKHGHTTIEYGDGMVRCYFADNSDQTAVQIGKWPNQIQVRFHARPDFEGFSVCDCEQVPQIVIAARKLLEEEREKLDRRTEEEIASEKLARIQRLKEELASLSESEAA